MEVICFSNWTAYNKKDCGSGTSVNKSRSDPGEKKSRSRTYTYSIITGFRSGLLLQEPNLVVSISIGKHCWTKLHPF